MELAFFFLCFFNPLLNKSKIVIIYPAYWPVAVIRRRTQTVPSKALGVILGL